jgi:hypothetical protein
MAGSPDREDRRPEISWTASRLSEVSLVCMAGSVLARRRGSEDVKLEQQAESYGLPPSLPIGHAACRAKPARPAPRTPDPSGRWIPRP